MVQGAFPYKYLNIVNESFTKYENGQIPRYIYIFGQWQELRLTDMPFFQEDLDYASINIVIKINTVISMQPAI